MKTLAALRDFTLLGALGALVLPAACAASDDGGDQSAQDITAGPNPAVALDANDVSFLFPIVDSKPVPEISMDLKGSAASVDLYPQTLMADVANFQKAQGATSLDGPAGDRANWRVVSFRFDPCVVQPTAADAAQHFPTKVVTNLDAQLSTCTIMIRLVVQPFVDGKDVDTAVHLNYAFGVGNKAARDRILGELQTLKGQSPAPTSGVPLGPHPGLAKDPKGTFATAVRDFLATELSQGQLGLAASIATNRGDPWTFVIGTVDAKKQHWTPAGIKAFGFNPDGSGKVMVQSSIHGSTSMPTGITGEDNVAASVGALFLGNPTGASGDIAHQVNNPDFTSVVNSDCVSCHAATERVVDMKIPSSAARFAIPKGVTAYVEQKNTTHSPPLDEGGASGQFNFRAFGYFFGQPTVSYRAANETAAIVERINDDLLHKDVGPGPVCDEEKVWTCFRDGNAASECLSATNGCKPSH